MLITATPKLHPAQFIILEALRHQPTLRYSQLCKVSGLDSDVFKFHIRKLISLKVIYKVSNGEYRLTTSGKEYANNLNDTTRSILKQPKQSLLLIVRNKQTQELLLQRRQRQPNWGTWGFISGPLVWGSKPEEVAADELLKQTGLHASFTVAAFYRKQFYGTDSQLLLEDNFFTILTAQVSDQTPDTTWHAGYNQWLSAEKIATLPKTFADTQIILTMLERQQTYLFSRFERHEADF